MKDIRSFFSRNRVNLFSVLGFIFFILYVVMSSKQISELRRETIVLRDSAAYFRQHSTYIIYHRKLWSDTLGKTFTREVITDYGDTIKNIKYRNARFSVIGVSTMLYPKIDSVKLKPSNAKIIENIINEEKGLNK